MSTKTDYIRLSTGGRTEITDITEEVRAKVRASGAASGTVTVFCVGSTGGLTTVEYEPGLVHDLKAWFERQMPYAADYEHHKTWHDDNGSSHLRASLLGPSLTVPFVDGELTLGTWQQVVFVDFDTRPRRRDLVVQIVS
jgi:secondary thiamine-phosphate synthase enzyme